MCAVLQMLHTRRSTIFFVVFACRATPHSRDVCEPGDTDAQDTMGAAYGRLQQDRKVYASIHK